jgi:hypothetical protein
MYVIEVYDREGKKSFIKELDSKTMTPAVHTKKKTEALKWRDRNQALMYASKTIADMYFGIHVPECMLSGFKVIKLK